MSRVAVVTGASSGIGEATARALAAEGFDVVIGARRVDRLEKLAVDIGATAYPLDVTNDESVAAFCARVERCDVLINNAGGAVGTDSVATADPAEWQAMYDTNVLGTLRMTKGLMPKLSASEDAHIVVITSVAAVDAYPSGGGYNAA